MFSFVRPKNLPPLKITGDRKPTPFQEDLQRSISAAMNPILKRRRDLMSHAIMGCVAGGICTTHDIQIANVAPCGCEGVVVVPMGAIFWTCIEHDYENNMVTVYSGWSTAPNCKHGNKAPVLPVDTPHATLRSSGEPLN